MHTLSTQRVDLILCDYRMPGMDGLTLFMEVHANPRWQDIPFIFLSAYAELNDRVSALRQGAADFMTKPAHTEELVARIVNTLKRSIERKKMIQGGDAALTASLEIMRMDDILEMFARERQTGILKVSSAQRLSIYRDPAAAPALAACLRDDSREVRVAAAIALAACGTRASVPPLLAALTDPDPNVCRAAAVALENLTGHTDDPASPRSAQAWRDWFRGTTWAKIEQALIKRVETGDRDVVRRAAVALGHVGSKPAKSILT